MSVPARRRQVAYSRERGLSVRRACTLFSVARSALNYPSRKVTKDAPVIERMKALAAQYPRYGYRRIGIFLGRDGYRDEPRSSLPAVAGSGTASAAQASEKARRYGPSAATGATAPNQVWSYDFVFDRCANGQQLKCLTVTDEFTKEGWRST